jgi:hypothetical protein
MIRGFELGWGMQLTCAVVHPRCLLSKQLGHPDWSDQCWKSVGTILYLNLQKGAGNMPSEAAVAVNGVPGDFSAVLPLPSALMAVQPHTTEAH